MTNEMVEIETRVACERLYSTLERRERTRRAVSTGSPGPAARGGPTLDHYDNCPTHIVHTHDIQSALDTVIE